MWEIDGVNLKFLLKNHNFFLNSVVFGCIWFERFGSDKKRTIGNMILSCPPSFGQALPFFFSSSLLKYMSSLSDRCQITFATWNFSSKMFFIIMQSCTLMQSSSFDTYSCFCLKKPFLQRWILELSPKHMGYHVQRNCSVCLGFFITWSNILIQNVTRNLSWNQPVKIS